MEVVMEKERRTTRKDRFYYFPSIKFKRLLPEMMGDWLVYSGRLSREVTVNFWNAEHAKVDEEEQRLRLMEDLDEEPYHPPSENVVQLHQNTRDQRAEKIDGVALADELSRLREKQDRPTFSESEKRRLDFLEAVNTSALPPVGSGSPPPPERWLTVVYGKSREIGRRTASHPSYQHCPSSLRPLLAKHYYHDVDIVNCHPTLFLQVAKKMGVGEDELGPLHEYVTDRDAVLNRIGEWYGVPAKRCKYAVLRVLNGGSLYTWVKDEKCTRNHDDPQPDLTDLELVANAVREAFFKMDPFQSVVKTLTESLKVSTQSTLKRAEACLQQATTPDERIEAEKMVKKARMKATQTAIKRSVFSACAFELEDTILDVIDVYLQENGWTVSSLQFDGLHVEHRADSILRDAMDGAEEAVNKKLGYQIKLDEKDLFEVTQ